MKKTPLWGARSISKVPRRKNYETIARAAAGGADGDEPSCRLRQGQNQAVQKNDLISFP